MVMCRAVFETVTAILVEPRDGLIQPTGLVLRFNEKMAFAR